MSTSTQDGNTTFLRSYYSGPGVRASTDKAFITTHAKEPLHGCQRAMVFAVDGNLGGQKLTMVFIQI